MSQPVPAPTLYVPTFIGSPVPVIASPTPWPSAVITVVPPTATVGASGVQVSFGAPFTFTETEPVTAPPVGRAPGMPATGNSTAAWVILALVVIVAGVALFAFGRGVRRRRAD